MTTRTSSADQPIPRGQPLREAVYERIVTLICSGEYAPGAALTEAGLSSTLQVSRTPVREALLRLEADGILQSALARGFTVRPLDVTEAGELYPILSSLEALALRSATGVDEAVLDQLRRTMAELAACVDAVRRWQLDSQWHDLLVSLGGNSKLSAMVKRLRMNLSRYELTYMREVTSRHEADTQHAGILEALGRGDRRKAAELVEAHWQQGGRAVVRWLTRS